MGLQDPGIQQGLRHGCVGRGHLEWTTELLGAGWAWEPWSWAVLRMVLGVYKPTTVREYDAGAEKGAVEDGSQTVESGLAMGGPQDWLRLALMADDADADAQVPARARQRLWAFGVGGVAALAIQAVGHNPYGSLS
jgi:hypothetical protein